jgi:3-hydroxyacyl-[acyl-carrier-protein] dehydratase
VRWMWIDRILELRPRERLVAIKNISLAEDHLHQHLGASGGLPALPVMPGSLIIEGMAQSAGILVGHAEGFREKVILGKVTRADLRHDAPPGYTLRYTATLQNLSPAGGSTAGRVDLLDPATGAGEHLCSATPTRTWPGRNSRPITSCSRSRSACCCG